MEKERTADERAGALKVSAVAERSFACSPNRVAPPRNLPTITTMGDEKSPTPPRAHARHSLGAGRVETRLPKCSLADSELKSPPFPEARSVGPWNLDWDTRNKKSKGKM
ncbi:hypothetical protein NPIL_82221 [Nephila pilipes]|uniref:Uncharacterized protein n=1 Tax=Nephila pilipes TaxID=299642 RepID=A0A8X6QW01_NEPPI|nr:hypothetical protein NPIL_82221 [Nephila pilipes]